jgi:hypothetical protein
VRVVEGGTVVDLEGRRRAGIPKAPVGKVAGHRALARRHAPDED